MGITGLTGTQVIPVIPFLGEYLELKLRLFPFFYKTGITTTLVIPVIPVFWKSIWNFVHFRFSIKRE